MPKPEHSCHNIGISAFGGKTNSSVAERFSAAAETYHRLANIQRHVAAKLMDLLASAEPSASRLGEARAARRRLAKPGMPRRLAPSLILVVGCGTGLLTEMLLRTFPKASIEAVDISPAMTKKAYENLAGNKLVNLIVADAGKLTETKKYPLIVSNCVLHWIEPIQTIIQKLSALLEPDGTLAFAVMLRGTLVELNSARERIAPHKPPRVTLPDETDVRRAMNKANLKICGKKSETMRHEYFSAEKMLKQLHDQGLTGGNNLHGRNLLTRSELSHLIADYSKNYKSKHGVYASYHVFYCVAAKNKKTT